MKGHILFSNLEHTSTWIVMNVFSVYSWCVQLYYVVKGLFSLAT